MGLLVVGVLSAGLLAGCAPEPAPSPAPTPTVTALTPEEEAFRAAEATYRAYVDALNRVDLADPETFEPLYALTTGELETHDRNLFEVRHAGNYTLSGKIAIVRLELVRWMPSKGQLRLSTCVDVSEVDVRDASGSSIVSPNRPEVQSLIVDVDVSDRSSPLLSSIAGDEGKTCTP